MRLSKSIINTAGDYNITVKQKKAIVPDLLICIDEEGKILYSGVNRDFEGDNYFNLIYKKDHGWISKLHKKVLTGKEPAAYNFKSSLTAKLYHVTVAAFRNRTLMLSVRESVAFDSTPVCRICKDSVQSIILILDKQGRIINFNAYMEKISGYKLEEVVGKNWFRVFIPKDENTRIRDLFEHTIKGKPTKGNINAIIAKNGSYKIIEWYARRISDKTHGEEGVISFGQDITERIKFEENLRENEAQLSLSLKLARIGTLVYDLENNYFIFNAQFYELFRIDMKVMKSYKVSLEKYLNKFISADDHQIYRRLFREASDGSEWSENVETEHPFIYGNGEKGYVAVRMFRVRNREGKVIKIFGANQDITQRVRYEEELRTREGQLSLAQKIAKIGYWEYDAAENLFHFNDHFFSIFKTSVENVGSYAMSPESYAKAFLHPDDVDIVRRETDAALTTNDPDFNRHLEHRVIFADGSIGYISVHFFIAKDKNGKTIKTFGANQDITHHKEVERKLAEQNEMYLKVNNQLNKSLKKLRQMNRELKDAKNRAEESDQLKSAFLANMSHEIRTPMNGIIGFSKLLNKPNLTEDRRRHYTNIINDMCHQLLNLINGIIDISKIETGQIKVRLTKVNINNLMYLLFSFYKQVAEKSNINLYMKKALKDEHSEIETDATKLRQILDNLIGNALKFTHEGFVRFGYEIIDGGIEFFVEDTGIGIPEGQHQAIFERFSQIQIQSDKVYSGTGLGLAITKAFVEKLGGQIRVVSALGKGTAFYFTLPCKLTLPEDETADPDQSATPKPKILVVEDEDYNYLYLEELLLELDVDILHAKSGEEAIKLCQVNSDISLILMDIKLPDINGFEVLKRVKVVMPDVPVIAQTAYALSGDKEIAIEMGFSDYLSKPIDDVEFANMVKKYLETRYS